MIPLERAASGKAEAVSGLGGARQTPTPLRGDTGTPRNGVPAWEALYWAISPDQQRELLTLAERQGVLYAHQLPAMTNGTTVEPSRRLLTRILNGEVAELRPAHPEPIDVGDSALGAGQREAVAKALSTPDIFLMQGRPGSGKSRVAAEIIACATARGERVLLLAPTTAAIDRVLEGVISRDVVFPVRCLDRDENVASLPAAIQALTFEERARSLTVHALESARQRKEVSEQSVRCLRGEESLLRELDELASRWTALESDCQTLQKSHSQIASEVAEEAEAAQSTLADGFSGLLRDLTRAHEEARLSSQTRLVDLRSRIEAGARAQTVLDAELDTLRPLVEAKQQRRWWTAAWWQALPRGESLLTQWAQRQQHLQQSRTELDSLREQDALLTRHWEEAERLFAGKRAELMAAEVARRQVDLDDRIAALRREQSVLQQKWHALCQNLPLESSRPTAMTAQAVQETRAAWCRKLEQAEAELTFARQWLAHLEQTPEMLAGRLARYINLVAATITALPRNEQFGEGVLGMASQPDFDLLVLEEADQITESELLYAARRARRWVLIGDAGWPNENAPAQQRHRVAPREQTTGSSGLRARAPASLRCGVFQRLWQHLHCDPRHLPYSWLRDHHRLCCRLRTLPAEQRQWITTEHVADCPDIEIRILTLPGCRPTLAEIVFPPAFSIEQAKEYIFQELEELAVQASGGSLRWVDEPDRLVLRLTDRDLTHGPAIRLVPGIREILGSALTETNGSPDPAAEWQTCCLEFDREAGWNRPRAAEWIQQHLGLRDLGRTARLDVCYRMEKSLSSFVSNLLAASGSQSGATSAKLRIHGVERNGSSATVEFVPVPTLRDNPAAPAHGKPSPGQRGRPAAGAGSARSLLPRKGGTGLEVDLSDSRLHERLPSDLRSGLPSFGFVNYPEAQAVVQMLLHLVKEMGQLDRHAERAQSSQPALAVVALYPAQAELIRRLIRQEPVLAELGPELQVGVPGAFRQREAAVVLLSLTRSHTHRAVTFGEGPQMLTLAMTRARSRLLVFGDAGTLARRSDWEGPLDHLDEETAARERQVITRLVDCLEACGSEPQPSHPRQGSGP